MNLKTLAESIGLDEEEYAEIFELFVETGRADLERLQTAIKEKDTKKIEEAAHSLKGASGNIGLMELYEISDAIVQKARCEQLEGIEESVKSLRKKFEELTKLSNR